MKENVQADIFKILDEKIDGLKLVANYGSYWVYEILSEASQLGS